MIRVDGRMCYEWNGKLLRAKDGVIEWRPKGGGAWQVWDEEGDVELERRLPDLVTYWDKDV